jgi:hypothetical protein
MLPIAVDWVLLRSPSSWKFHEAMTDELLGTRGLDSPFERPERAEKSDGEALEGSVPGRKCSVEAMIFISYMAERPVLKLPRLCMKLSGISVPENCAKVGLVGEPM